MDPQYAYQSAPANFMPMMAGGGLAAAAQQVQKQGREGDTMLVHMAPSEVKGLDALARAHGGQITINPTTGLPEAKFLKRLLPTLIGAGLSFIPGVGPLMAAGLVGGVETLRTGNLGKGLMAGLGAFGGAGMASALTGAGAAAANTAAQAAQQNILAQGGTQVAADNAFRQVYMNQVGQSGLGTAVQGAKSIFSGGAAGEAARSGAMASMGGLGGTAKTIGAAAAPVIAGSMTEQTTPGGMGTGTYLRPYEFTRTPRAEAYETVPSPGAGSVERRYFNDSFNALPIQKVADFAAGGPVDMDPGMDPTQNVNINKVSASSDAYAMGGLTAFARGGLPPRYLQGDGDGMSDSIKANIDGKQEARLADGEFVIPADVVAHLGNGSSNAGAKRLHSMMNRIRQARTGKARQAPQVRAERFMPA
jgi:hypothetical protein